MSFQTYLFYDAGYSKLAIKFPTTTEEFCNFWLGIGLNLPVEILCMVDLLRSNMMESLNIVYHG